MRTQHARFKTAARSLKAHSRQSVQHTGTPDYSTRDRSAHERTALTPTPTTTIALDAHAPTGVPGRRPRRRQVHADPHRGRLGQGAHAAERSTCVQEADAHARRRKRRPERAHRHSPSRASPWSAATTMVSFRCAASCSTCATHRPPRFVALGALQRERLGLTAHAPPDKRTTLASRPGRAKRRDPGAHADPQLGPGPAGRAPRWPPLRPCHADDRPGACEPRRPPTGPQQRALTDGAGGLLRDAAVSRVRTPTGRTSRASS